MRHSPPVHLFGKNRTLQQYDWWQLGSYLVDTIIEAFRPASQELEPAKSALLAELRQFFIALTTDYEIAIVTLNYDDAIWRVVQNLETGFDPSGPFDERRLFERSDWGCFLHLHGPVHFDMQARGTSLHE
jgi:hypothetical protein